MAPVEDRRTKAIDYGSVYLGRRLAAYGRWSVDLQKI